MDLLRSEHSILILSGAWPGEQMEGIAKRLAQEKRLLEFHTYGDGLKMFLDQERGDILVGADILYLTARERWHKEIYALPNPIWTDTLHIMLSKKTAEEDTLKKFNAAIAQAKVQQAIQALVKRSYTQEPSKLLED